MHFFKTLGSAAVLLAMVVIGLADSPIDECGCTSVGAQVFNNGAVAPTTVEVSYRTQCVDIHVPTVSGVSTSYTDSSVVFAIDSAVSFDLRLWTNDHASATSCDEQTIEIFAQ
ncbi:hypothetical protein N9Y13_03285 [Schleiferiaceae bacterium]|jgi:hypothetical protein|nr:hypothetical protein [Schleiferiaceae bacterium]